MLLLSFSSLVPSPSPAVSSSLFAEAPASMLVNTTARTYYARELVLPSRRIFGRTFFSPPAPQPTSSTPSTTLAPPSHVPQEAGTVRVQSQGIKTNVSVRVGADRPSYVSCSSVRVTVNRSLMSSWCTTDTFAIRTTAASTDSRRRNLTSSSRSSAPLSPSLVSTSSRATRSQTSIDSNYSDHQQPKRRPSTPPSAA